jgi:thiol:disulfide interchange protein DsbA
MILETVVRAHFLIALTALVLSACGGSETPTGVTPTEPASASAAASPQPTPQPQAAQEDAAAPTEPAAVARTEPRAEIGERRFREGTHYERLQPQQPTSTSGDKVEVAEVFMYSCPHCFTFEPYIEQWSETKADYIDLVRIPAAWNPLAELHARAYYTAEALGKLDEMHAPFFREFHVNRNYLDTEAYLRDFFGEFGVDGETFDNTFNSFAVHTKIQRAKDLVQRYRVSGTPGIVVNGKYLTSGSMAQSYENWFDIIDELAAVEWASQ